jgi:hypothetical protein
MKMKYICTATGRELEENAFGFYTKIGWNITANCTINGTIMTKTYAKVHCRCGTSHEILIHAQNKLID